MAASMRHLSGTALARTQRRPGRGRARGFRAPGRTPRADRRRGSGLARRNQPGRARLREPGSRALGPQPRHGGRGAGGRHRPGRRLRAPVRHLAAAARRPARAPGRPRAQQVPWRCRAAGTRAAAVARTHRRPGAGGAADGARPWPARGRRPVWRCGCRAVRRGPPRGHRRHAAPEQPRRVPASAGACALRWARTRRRHWSAPTGSSCPAPSRSAATCVGCASRAWQMPSLPMPVAVGGSWDSAAACRCSGTACTTRWEWTVSPTSNAAGWACCRWSPTMRRPAAACRPAAL